MAINWNVVLGTAAQGVNKALGDAFEFAAKRKEEDYAEEKMKAWREQDQEKRRKQAEDAKNSEALTNVLKKQSAIRGRVRALAEDSLYEEGFASPVGSSSDLPGEEGVAAESSIAMNKWQEKIKERMASDPNLHRKAFIQLFQEHGGTIPSGKSMKDLLEAADGLYKFGGKESPLESARLRRANAQASREEILLGQAPDKFKSEQENIKARTDAANALAEKRRKNDEEDPLETEAKELLIKERNLRIQRINQQIEKENKSGKPTKVKISASHISLIDDAAYDQNLSSKEISKYIDGFLALAKEGLEDPGTIAARVVSAIKAGRPLERPKNTKKTLLEKLKEEADKEDDEDEEG